MVDSCNIPRGKTKSLYSQIVVWDDEKSLGKDLDNVIKDKRIYKSM